MENDKKKYSSIDEYVRCSPMRFKKIGRDKSYSENDSIRCKRKNNLSDAYL